TIRPRTTWSRLLEVVPENPAGYAVGARLCASLVAPFPTSTYRENARQNRCLVYPLGTLPARVRASFRGRNSRQKKTVFKARISHHERGRSSPPKSPQSVRSEVSAGGRRSSSGRVVVTNTC